RLRDGSNTEVARDWFADASGRDGETVVAVDVHQAVRQGDLKGVGSGLRDGGAGGGGEQIGAAVPGQDDVVGVEGEAVDGFVELHRDVHGRDAGFAARQPGGRRDRELVRRMYPGLRGGSDAGVPPDVRDAGLRHADDELPIRSGSARV